MKALQRNSLFSDREEFKPETITGKGSGEQLLTLHRKNCRLYYLYLPPGADEMVYVENFFETHWLEKARFGRRNVPWASVEFVREGSLLAESPDLPHPLRIPAGSLLWIPPIRETLLRTGPEGQQQQALPSLQKFPARVTLIIQDISGDQKCIPDMDDLAEKIGGMASMMNDASID